MYPEWPNRINKKAFVKRSYNYLLWSALWKYGGKGFLKHQKKDMKLFYKKNLLRSCKKCLRTTKILIRLCPGYIVCLNVTHWTGVQWLGSPGLNKLDYLFFARESYGLQLIQRRNFGFRGCEAFFRRCRCVTYFDMNWVSSGPSFIDQDLGQFEDNLVMGFRINLFPNSGAGFGGRED